MEDLKKEFQIFKILLLKNFSSQKHFNHFQKFSKVKRIAQKLIDIDLPTEQDISTSKTLSNLMDKFKLSLNLKSAVLDSYNATRIQAQNAWFLPLNLTFMALLASIYCITNELMDEQRSAYEREYRKLEITDTHKFPFKIDGDVQEIQQSSACAISKNLEFESDTELQGEIILDLAPVASINLSDQFFSQQSNFVSVSNPKRDSKRVKKKSKKPSSSKPMDDIDSIFDNL